MVSNQSIVAYFEIMVIVVLMFSSSNQDHLGCMGFLVELLLYGSLEIKKVLDYRKLILVDITGSSNQFCYLG